MNTILKEEKNMNTREWEAYESSFFPGFWSVREVGHPGRRVAHELEKLDAHIIAEAQRMLGTLRLFLNEPLDEMAHKNARAIIDRIEGAE